MNYLARHPAIAVTVASEDLAQAEALAKERRNVEAVQLDAKDEKALKSLVREVIVDPDRSVFFCVMCSHGCFIIR